MRSRGSLGTWQGLGSSFLLAREALKVRVKLFVILPLWRIRTWEWESGQGYASSQHPRYQAEFDLGSFDYAKERTCLY